MIAVYASILAARTRATVSRNSLVNVAAIADAVIVDLCASIPEERFGLNTKAWRMESILSDASDVF